MGVDVSLEVFTRGHVKHLETLRPLLDLKSDIHANRPSACC